MWEVYAMWGSASAFFLDFFLARGASAARAGMLSGAVAFAVIGMGGIGWLLHAPFALVLPVALVWGFAVVADSAQFSAVVTEVAPPHAVGTALTLQTALGFLLTSVTLTAVPYLRDAAGWPLAFGILAIGPMLGIAAMRRLENVRIREAEGQP